MRKHRAFLAYTPDVPRTTAQQHKVAIIKGRPRFYDPAALKKVRAEMMRKLKEAAPEEPFEGPLELYAVWRFRAVKGKRDGEYKTTRPDVDNLMKLLRDCMTATGWWADDSLVVEEHTCKVWSDDPGIYIQVSEIEEAEPDD